MNHSFEFPGVVPTMVLIPGLDENGDGVEDSLVVAKDIKVAKWEDAFEGTSGSGQVKEDFIDWDKDRFHLAVANGVNLGITAAEIATVDNPDQ